MASFTCAAAFVLALLTIPVLILLRVTESRPATINRLRRQGMTWKQIGERFNCSPSTAKRWSVA